MTSDELEQVLRAFARRRPFQPYLIEFNSGGRVRVTHPDCINRQEELFHYVGPSRDQRVFTGANVSQLIDAASSSGS
jgi:hypothetical protein